MILDGSFIYTIFGFMKKPHMVVAAGDDDQKYIECKTTLTQSMLALLQSM